MPSSPPPDEPSIDIGKVKWERTAPGEVVNTTPIVFPPEIVEMAKDIQESVSNILAMSDEELMGGADDLLPRDWEGKPVDRSLVDDLADVLVRMVVGWESVLGNAAGINLAEHPDVVRVMARYRESKNADA